MRGSKVLVIVPPLVGVLPSVPLDRLMADRSLCLLKMFVLSIGWMCFKCGDALLHDAELSISAQAVGSPLQVQPISRRSHLRMERRSGLKPCW